ncbi:Methyltransferase domain-containing protein [Alicyclobacillus tolerans]|uniref:Methyltransferase domain-containing protein n=1 Tax=Alicyclobacillus tolerans TaxID=90970 RepID=A0A1M6R5L8_9BACL|nr:Methyltransferase domain-containing protein [Alicyclobacillus montanus]
MVEATRIRVGPQVTVLEQDLSEVLLFEDETFDIILSSLTLHYFDDWTTTFQEFHRVIKTGGRFVYSVHHPFMDFKLFDRPDYFVHELLEEVLNKKESGPVEVTFFRRPMSEIINVTTGDFTLVHIIEPKPVSEFIKKSRRKQRYIINL